MVKAIRRPRPLPVLPSRECGACTECCGPALEITEAPAAHPRGEPCPRKTEAGCSAYEERPPVCRTFRCLWLMGWGEEDWRPDRLGVMVTMLAHPAAARAHAATGIVATDSNLEQRGEALVYNVVEVHPGALPMAALQLDEWATPRPVMTRPLVGAPRLHAPLAWLEAAAEAVADT